MHDVHNQRQLVTAHNLHELPSASEFDGHSQLSVERAWRDVKRNAIEKVFEKSESRRRQTSSSAVGTSPTLIIISSLAVPSHEFTHKNHKTMEVCRNAANSGWSWSPANTSTSRLRRRPPPPPPAAAGCPACLL